jgi:NTP pyrophosphatase (non-canonical NTP hydrolase)
VASDKVSDLTKELVAFRDARNWSQFHNAKDVAISLSLEASELLELFQWKTGADLEKHALHVKQQIGEELSDILYWTLLLAHDLQIDLPSAFMEKLKSNAAKYPIQKARDSSTKYDQFDE